MSKHLFTIPSTSTIVVVGGGSTLTFSAFSASPGLDGESAYQMAVRLGFVGSEADWLASLSNGTPIDIDLTAIYNLSK